MGFTVRVLAAAIVLTMTTPTALAHADESTVTTTTIPPFSTPNTDRCPNRSTPPPPTDKSEVPKPGDSAPKPLPQPSEPVGGSKLGGCGLIKPNDPAKVPDKIGAASWLVADLDTGEVIAAKDPHGRYRPASTLKILLAVAALRELSLNTVITGTDEDANMEGSRVGIGRGGRYSNLELMQALMLVSGNDAANALARQLGGTDATLTRMNDIARELGALDTRAVTVCGLDGPGMATSAYDLALFFREAMTNSDFARIVRTEQAKFPGFPKDPTIAGDTDKPGFAIGNDNQLLYNYPGAIGGKTGYTDDAHHTYVGAAERSGRRLVVTIMDTSATYVPPWEQGARLLDYGFAVKGDGVGTLDVKGIADSVTTTAAPAATVAAAPEPQHTSTERPALVRVAIALLGGLIVCLLVLAAMSLKRRR